MLPEPQTKLKIVLSNFQNSSFYNLKQRFTRCRRSQRPMSHIPTRNKIVVGKGVQIVQKQDQRTGVLTDGRVKRILTKSKSHPHGIKVELENGEIGRVQKMLV